VCQGQGQPEQRRELLDASPQLQDLLPEFRLREVGPLQTDHDPRRRAEPPTGRRARDSEIRSDGQVPGALDEIPEPDAMTIRSGIVRGTRRGRATDVATPGSRAGVSRANAPSLAGSGGASGARVSSPASVPTASPNINSSNNYGVVGRHRPCGARAAHGAGRGARLLFVIVSAFAARPMWVRLFDAAVWITLFNVLSNGCPVMLQRYNRLRLERLRRPRS